MKNQINPMTEWKAYGKLFASSPALSALKSAAYALQDPTNRKVALRNLGIMTTADRQEIDARWKAINETTDAECRAHCQFAGLPTLNS